MTGAEDGVGTLRFEVEQEAIAWIHATIRVFRYYPLIPFKGLDPVLDARDKHRRQRVERRLNNV